MNDLTLDLALHAILTILAAYIVYKKYHERGYAFWGAVIGGILIDLDHFIDYFMAYGPLFSISTFLQGRQFIVSNKIFIFFHAWEYIAVIILLLFIVKRNIKMYTLLLALLLSMIFHLITDTVISKSQLRLYSIMYRYSVNFNLDKLSSPYEIKHLRELRKQYDTENSR